MSRAELALTIAAAAGDGVVVKQAHSGWPSIMEVHDEAAGDPIVVAAYVGRVGSMSRQPHERRFQNPGQNRPIEPTPGCTQLLVGFCDELEHPLIVSADASRRVGHDTRFSILFPVDLLHRAHWAGWASYTGATGEVISAFHPAMLPYEVLCRRDGDLLTDPQVTAALLSPGSLEGLVERAKLATTRLQRDHKFSHAVLQAYEYRCAVSGLGLRLVSGAHIYPVSAPGSVDVVSNGLALSDNAHRLFDSHRLFIEPLTFKIVLHPDVLSAASLNSSDAHFIKGIRTNLRVPSDTAQEPASEFLEKRYDYYSGCYSWAS